jgi:hypothetical protein
MRVHRWVACAILCLFLGVVLVLGPLLSGQALASGAEEQRLLGLINEYREANGAGPLVPSGTLATTAGHHSEDMATYDFFSHQSKDSSYYPIGSEPVDRAAQDGYPTDVADTAENIAWGQPTAEEVFQDWRLSPDHNAHMLDKRYTTVGIGHDGAYWTADFGSVADSAPSSGETAPGTESTSTERLSEPQTSDKPVSSRKERPGEATPATQPDKEASPDTSPEPDGARSTPDLDSSSDPAPPDSETPEPSVDTEGPSDAPDSGQTSKPQTADQQPDPENIATRTPTSAQPTKSLGADQYTVDGPPPSTTTPRISSEDPANKTPSETTPAEQDPVPQPRTQQPATPQPADEHVETTPTKGTDGEESQAAPSMTPATDGGATDQYTTDEETPPVEVPPPSPEEVTPQTASSAEPTTDGHAAEQDTADGEAAPAEVSEPSSGDQATKEPAAEPVSQTPSAAPAERQAGDATPAETGATQPLQAVPTAAPVKAAQQRAPYTTEELSTRTPTAQAAPAAVASGATTQRSTPPAVKELPRTSGAPLPLFTGVMLLLSGLVIYWASRKQRGRS